MPILNKEQTAALDAVKTGQNIFITGSPGTGKSFTLKTIISYLKSRDLKYAVTSSTGCAAILINGQTIHSYLGLGIGNQSVEKIVSGLQRNMRKYKSIDCLNVLIIDEISMLDDSTFIKISEVLKAVKQISKPFGGIQCIFVGDFCQLSPVTGNYCFTTSLWKDLNLVSIHLCELIRQKDDKVFQEILQQVRFGKCTKNVVKALSDLQTTVFEDGVRPTRLYPLNSDVNAINTYEFNQLFKSTYGISATDAKMIQCWPIDYDIDTVNTDTNQCIHVFNALSNDKKIALDDYKIALFPGLLVMVTRNVNFEEGLINGTTGIITQLTSKAVYINSGNKKHVITYCNDTNDNNGSYVRFMPIKLAYALSIHKAQGATLDAIEIDASTNIFACGQLYTALSRARSLKNIKLLNFDKYSFICNPNVKQFYENLEK